MKVLKFGGTSVKDASAFLLVKEIIGQTSEQMCVVLSATASTTNALIEIHKHAVDNPIAAYALIDEIEARHIQIAEDLALNGAISSIKLIASELRSLIKAISHLGEITSKQQARIVSAGEMLSTLILEHLLVKNEMDAARLDSSQFIKTSGNALCGIPEFSLTKKNLAKLFINLPDKHIYIFQGFIASSAIDDTHTTLGRGGSDFTASIIAKSIKADEVIIYTDVDGVMSADPREIPKAKINAHLSYDEMRELAFLGAKVLHPETIKPAIEANIPVFIRNTFNHKSSGTRVTTNSHEETIAVLDILDTFEFSYNFDKCEANFNKLQRILQRYEQQVVYSTRQDGISRFWIKQNELSAFFQDKIYDSLGIKCQVAGIIGIIGSSQLKQKALSYCHMRYDDILAISYNKTAGMYIMVHPGNIHKTFKEIHSLFE